MIDEKVISETENKIILDIPKSGQYGVYLKNVSSDRVMISQGILTVERGKWKMKKTRIFLGILGLICLVAMPVSAADNVRNITTYSICREDLYKDQIEDRMGLQQISIESGKTVSFYDSNGSMFYVSGGTTVTFRVNLNVSSSVKMGYINQNGSRTQKYSGSGTSHKTSFTILSSGYYRFYVTNSGSKTVKVTGGEICF